MSDKVLHFPQDFLWGASTAAHQVEGNNSNNNWSEFEQQKKTVHKQSSGIASDHYNRFEEDFDIAKSLHHSIHRFSIEWSRIEPKEGLFDAKEVEHYRQVIEAIHKRGMKVMVTLLHFTTPLWFAKSGGWERKDSVQLFVRFVEYIVNQFGESVDFWITINEPSGYAAKSYFFEMSPPAKKNLYKFFKVLSKLETAHKEAYFSIHRLLKHAQVGLSHYVAYTEPYRKSSLLDKMISRLLYWLSNDFFLNRIKHSIDFLGVQYFSRIRLRFQIGGYLGIFEEIGVLNTEYEGNKCDIGWNIYPEGLYESLKRLKKYNVPIYVTENGVADQEDNKRKVFIRDHLIQLHRAIRNGVDVQGYLHWSLIDDFGWTYGKDERYGLVEIDYEKNLERTVRPSARYYAGICKDNQLVL